MLLYLERKEAESICPGAPLLWIIFQEIEKQNFNPDLTKYSYGDEGTDPQESRADVNRERQCITAETLEQAHRKSCQIGSFGE